MKKEQEFSDVEKELIFSKLFFDLSEIARIQYFKSSMPLTIIIAILSLINIIMIILFDGRYYISISSVTFFISILLLIINLINCYIHLKEYKKSKFKIFKTIYECKCKVESGDSDGEK